MENSLRSYWDLVEPFFDHVDLTEPSQYFTSIALIPQPIVLLFASHFCLSEVHSGGLLQFFWNSTGMLAPEAIDGFGAVGMPKLADALRTAAALLGSPYPRDRDERWDAMLAAGGRSEGESARIFQQHSGEATGLYQAFQEATVGLEFEAKNKILWKLAKTENGDFQEAASVYAHSFRIANGIP